MWREKDNGCMSERRICPVMSDSRGIVLCQGKNCAAAFSRTIGGEVLWDCVFLAGDRPGRGGDP